MSLVEIAFPVSKIVTRLTVRKGRPWSIVERVILEAVVARPRTADDLCSGTGLPSQVVVAGIHRLMRADWIRMQQSNGQLFLTTTPYGMHAASADELPHYGRTKKTSIALLYDRIAGHIFQLKDLEHFHSEQPLSRPTPLGATLDPSLPEGMYRLDEMLDIGLADDEQLLSVDAPDEMVSQRLAIVRVIDGRVAGLPKGRAYPALEAAILAAARQIAVTPNRSPQSKTKTQSTPHADRSIRFEDKDLIVGGREHRDIMMSLIENARTRLVIHSTFLDERKIRELLPRIFEAVDRKVLVDILWGQDARENDSPAQKQNRKLAAEIAAALRDEPNVRKRAERLRIHTHSTGSHAKILLADIGEEGRMIAAVGSCNWLASGFKSVEASVVLRTPSIVCDVVRCLVRLTQASNPRESLLVELMKVIHMLQRRTETNPNARASLVIGDAHNDCVLRSRDEAHSRIFVASHRMSRKVMPGILVPLAAARERKKLAITALFGKLQGISEQDATRIVRHAADRRISLQSIYEPRVHAKVLAWDRNTIVVTSQNWLSADPPPMTLVNELGVVIDRPGVADSLLNRMRNKIHRETHRHHHGKFNHRSRR